MVDTKPALAMVGKQSGMVSKMSFWENVQHAFIVVETICLLIGLIIVQGILLIGLGARFWKWWVGNRWP